MKSILKFVKSVYMKITLGLLALLPAPVFATLPTATTIAGSSTTSTDDPVQMGKDLSTQAITIIATVMAAAIVVGAAWHIYSAYAEARKRGEWHGMATTAVVGVVMVVGGVLMGILAVQYGTF